ncbi:CD151 antigen-like [Argiope bruennichi]|uniref:CD151 antigen-like n=1 Tax=Argiope bruennichi TaxID=94029 RepID=UPI002493FB6E|nr:CD151 antigen-like [Argiope bruennichi]
MFRRADTDILVLHSDEVRHEALKRTLRVINFFLWLSGASVVSTGTFANVDMQHSNILLELQVFSIVNILLIVSGSVIVAFSIITCFQYFFKKRITLCVFTYLGTLVFVLQCVIASLSFTWREEIGVFVEKELNRFVLEDYKQVSRGPGKLLAFDHIQSAYHCCGANNYTDWQRSSWIQSRSSPNDLPVVCCRSTASMADCNLNNPDMVYKEGCIKFLKARYEMHFLIMGIVAIAVAFFQFICFHLTNYLMFKLE